MPGLTESGRAAADGGSPRAVFLRRAGLLTLLTFLTGLAASRPLPDVLRLEPGAAEGLRGIEPRTPASAILSRYLGAPGQEYRGADLAAYLWAGQVLLEEGRFEWAYARLWPPGQAMVAAAALSIGSGEDYLAHLQGVSVLLWALALAAVCWPFAGRGRWLAGLYAPGLWWVAPHLRELNFGLGVLMSESVSTALFVVGLALLARGPHLRRGPVIAGVAFGAAALTRPYFEFVLLHPLLVLGAAGVAWSWYRRRRGSSVPPASWAAVLLTVAVSAQATTVPWRVYRLVEFGSPSLTNFDQLTNWAFTPDAQLPSFHHSGNAACHADPDLCELVRANRPNLRPSLVKKLALMTAVTRPVAWARLKWANLDWLWFGAPRAELSQRGALAAEGLVLLALLVLSTLASLRGIARTQSSPPLVEITWVAFLLANALGFYLFQFEWRYTHALRVVAYLLPLLLIARRVSGANSLTQEPANA